MGPRKETIEMDTFAELTLPRRRLASLVLASTLVAPAIARGQTPDAPPEIVEDEPFEERVYQMDPYEQAESVTPTAPKVEGAAPKEPKLDDFKVVLSPHGRWVTTPQYGLVWSPRLPFAWWRPYTHGEWTYTAAGWTFVSYDAWGWAPFHYGRWVFLSSYGWCWIPGYTWGPAWVRWRYGGDYIAWAPLGPPGVAIVYYDTPSLWFAVNAGGFGRRIHRRHLLPTRRIRSVFSRTRRGPPPKDFVRRATGHPVREVRVHTVAPRWSKKGVFRPRRLERRARPVPPPKAVKKPRNVRKVRPAPAPPPRAVKKPRNVRKARPAPPPPSTVKKKKKKIETKKRFIRKQRKPNKAPNVRKKRRR